jgi:putative endonuclease
MKISNKELGKLGESIACEYLAKKGYQIVNKNFTEKFGEIDIIARSADGTLVFCEVKTLSGNENASRLFMPEDNINYRKMQKMKRMAQFFAAKNSSLIQEDRGWRIDVIAITIAAAADADESNKKTIRQIHHYKNV